MKLPVSRGKLTAGVQTTDKADFQNIPLPIVSAEGTFAITLPARSVLSIQFTAKSPADPFDAGVARSKIEIENVEWYASKEERQRRVSGLDGMTS